MDPFRDELGAAHAKIAELEARVRDLQSVRIEPTHPGKSSQPSFLLLFAGAVALSVVMMAGAFFIFRETRRASNAEPARFNGVATAAAESTSDTIPPIVNPGAVASASAKPTSKPPCNCDPGDPLCTCL